MTLSPELLAMIADEPAATDEELERWETWISHYCRTADTFPCSVAGFHSLIARIRAERKVGAISDVAAERKRQTEQEGWTPEHDNAHSKGQLAGAAASYILHNLSFTIPNIQLGHDAAMLAKSLWPWAASWWKPKDRRRDLVRAAALIIAEIERLDRAALSALEERG